MSASNQAVRVARVAAIALIMGAMGAGAQDQRAAEEIRALQARWVEAVAERDIDTIVGFFAPDAWFLPAGSPRLKGREEIETWWRDYLSDPPFESLEFGPVAVHVIDEQTLWEVGSSRTTIEDDSGNIEQRSGKYLILWKKIDGQWKVAADTFNSDQN